MIITISAAVCEHHAAASLSLEARSIYIFSVIVCFLLTNAMKAFFTRILYSLLLTQTVPGTVLAVVKPFSSYIITFHFRKTACTFSKSYIYLIM